MKTVIVGPKPRAGRWLTHKEYDFIFRRTPRLCVDAVIVKDFKVLLVKRRISPFRNFWTLPGGIIRYREAVDHALKRVLSRELNLTCEDMSLLGYCDTHRDGPWLQSISLVFFVQASGALRGSDEGHEFKYTANFNDRRIQPYQAEFLRRHVSPILRY